MSSPATDQGGSNERQHGPFGLRAVDAWLRSLGRRSWEWMPGFRVWPGQTIGDPACGTGGFLLSSYDYITHPGRYQLDRAQLRAPR